LESENGLQTRNPDRTLEFGSARPRAASRAGSAFAKLDCAFPAGAALTVGELLRADDARLVTDLCGFVQRMSRKEPEAAEIASWRSSIRSLRRLLDDPRLRGLTVLLEVASPLSSGRMDCVLLGSAAMARTALSFSN